MRSFLLLLALARGSGIFLSASDPRVLWTGRTRSNSYPPGSVAFDWEGVSASFTLAGTGVHVNLLANVTLDATCAGRISVFVDGFHTANMLLHSSASTYLLAAGLKAGGTHNVTVVYTMEPVNSCSTPAGDVAFIGFESDGSAFLPPVAASRRIDIIGDSITAGSQYDPEHALPIVCNDWLVTNSVTYNWESYVCRYFGANCTTIAWSGKGLVANGGCTAGATMPELYLQTEGGSPDAPPWNFAAASRPDAVIVYLGTNDFSCGTMTDAVFTAAYVQFLHNITDYYARSSGSAATTTFFCAIGPMSPTRPLNATLAAIAGARADGLDAHLLDMRNATLDGCGSHPGAVGHKAMALQAQPQIASVMNWARVGA